MRRFVQVASVVTVVSCGGSPTDESARLASPDASLAGDATVSNDGAGGPIDDGGAPSDAATGTCQLLGDGGATSQWVYVGADGGLAYKALAKGETILDFSYAGYHGGGVALPDLAVAKTLTPSPDGGDDTAQIQAALDAVTSGAVLLGPGTFNVAGALTFTRSNVVLRGSGDSGAQETTLDVSGSPRAIFSIAGTGSWTTATGTSATVTDAYVPSGTHTFHVDDPSKLSVGQAVLVDRDVTTAWIHFMGMDTLVRDGAAQTWLAPGTIIHSDRTVTAIEGDAITVDVPISDSFDATYTTATVTPYTFSGRISEIGIESLHVVAPKQSVPIDQPTFSILDASAVEDAWVRNVDAEEVTFGYVLEETARRVTLQDVSIERTAAIDGTQGYPFFFSIDGQETLVMRATTTSNDNDVFAYATMSRCPGPNVVLDLTSSGSPTNVQPHERWATGLLVDDVSVTGTGAAVGLMDRGILGSGHGWTIGFGVVWNGVAPSFLIQQPPGSMNWSIGSTGKQTTAGQPGSVDAAPLPQGIIDSQGTSVAPRSLYLAQLCERLGPQALAAIGY